MPSSNPLGKCYFQLILPKLDKRFTGFCRRAVCTKILNRAQKHKVKEKGVRQLGVEGGEGRGAAYHPRMASEASLHCPLSVPIEEGTRAGRGLPGTVWQGWINAFGPSTTALQLLLLLLRRQQPRSRSSPGGVLAGLAPEAAAGTDRRTLANVRLIHSQSLFPCRAGKRSGEKAENS